MRSVRNAMVTTEVGANTIISEEKVPVKRLVLEINNLNVPGGNDVFISVGEEATANKGRRIQPGQTITWSADSGYIPPQMRINAYSAGATNLAIYEEIEG